MNDFHLVIGSLCVIVYLLWLAKMIVQDAYEDGVYEGRRAEIIQSAQSQCEVVKKGLADLRNTLEKQ